MECLNCNKDLTKDDMDFTCCKCDIKHAITILLYMINKGKITKAGVISEILNRTE